MMKGNLWMKGTMEYLSSKLIKTRVILKNPQLSAYVPQTMELTTNRLFDMLKLYQMVYIKPVCGSRGIGVIKIEKGKNGFHFQEDTVKHSFRTFQQMYRSIQLRIGNKPYLVQRGIGMLKYSNRPFDFRVMVQKNQAGKWDCTGIVARLAHPKRVVTNGSQGGTIYAADELLTKVTNTIDAAKLIKRMTKMGLMTANQFSHSYPAMNEIGLDIAIDRQRKLWILEVNTRPDPCPFTKLSDHAMIDSIISYAKAYGRVYKLNCNKAKSAITIPKNKH
jgi:glutathione synthase/RimK-type ligase-like ATP-grasp enzyme